VNFVHLGIDVAMQAPAPGPPLTDRLAPPDPSPPRKKRTLPVETFEVVIRGRVSPTLLAAMEGFAASRCDHGLTHLVGTVSDQAQLHRLFQVLRDLNVELVTVTALDQRRFD
jgi:hypothetical protein